MTPAAGRCGGPSAPTRPGRAGWPAWPWRRSTSLARGASRRLHRHKTRLGEATQLIDGQLADPGVAQAIQPRPCCISGCSTPGWPWPTWPVSPRRSAAHRCTRASGNRSGRSWPACGTADLTAPGHPPWPSPRRSPRQPTRTATTPRSSPTGLPGRSPTSPMPCRSGWSWEPRTSRPAPMHCSPRRCPSARAARCRSRPPPPPRPRRRPSLAASAPGRRGSLRPYRDPGGRRRRGRHRSRRPAVRAALLLGGDRRFRRLPGDQQHRGADQQGAVPDRRDTRGYRGRRPPGRPHRAARGGLDDRDHPGLGAAWPLPPARRLRVLGHRHHGDGVAAVRRSSGTSAPRCWSSGSRRPPSARR